MSDFNLNFVQDRNEEGQIIYTLEPRLETFAYFEGKRPADIPPPRFNLRQLISKELEAEAMRKASGTEGDGTENAKTVGSIMNAYRKADEHAKPGKEAVRIWSSRLNAPSLKQRCLNRPLWISLEDRLWSRLWQRRHLKVISKPVSNSR